MNLYTRVCTQVIHGIQHPLYWIVKGRTAYDNPKGFCSTICQLNVKKFAKLQILTILLILSRKWPRMNFDRNFLCLEDKNDLMRFIIKIDLYVAERYWSSAYFKCFRAFFGKNSFVPILLFVTKSQITKFAILIFASQFVRRWRAELSTNLKGTAWNFQAKCVCNTFFFSG